MPLKIEEGKMFGWIEKTWNPVVGCRHGCVYCWARRLAKSRLRNKPRYRQGFKPQMIEKELSKRFYNKTVFVTSMGDLFGDWVPSKWVQRVVEAVTRSPTSTFLFLTKNPKRFKEFKDICPDNTILGTTIETNENFGVSSHAEKYQSQSRYQRYLEMKELEYPRKFVAIEPLMEFNIDIFEKWIKEIKPEKVSISYDNYNYGLPSPAIGKAIEFCGKLSKFTFVLPHGNWTRNPLIRRNLRALSAETKT